MVWVREGRQRESQMTQFSETGRRRAYSALSFLT